MTAAVDPIPVTSPAFGSAISTVLDATEGDLYAVKALLGHSSTRVTEVYLHSSRTRTESAVKVLTEYRRAASESSA